MFQDGPALVVGVAQQAHPRRPVDHACANHSEPLHLAVEDRFVDRHIGGRGAGGVLPMGNGQAVAVALDDLDWVGACDRELGGVWAKVDVGRIGQQHKQVDVAAVAKHGEGFGVERQLDAVFGGFVAHAVEQIGDHLGPLEVNKEGRIGVAAGSQGQSGDQNLGIALLQKGRVVARHLEQLLMIGGIAKVGLAARFGDAA